MFSFLKFKYVIRYNWVYISRIKFISFIRSPSRPLLLILAKHMLLLILGIILGNRSIIICIVGIKLSLRLLRVLLPIWLRILIWILLSKLLGVLIRELLRILLRKMLLWVLMRVLKLIVPWKLRIQRLGRLMRLISNIVLWYICVLCRLVLVCSVAWVLLCLFDVDQTTLN